MKESYERMKLEITEFLKEDVIVTSGDVDPLSKSPKDRFLIPILK